MAGGGKLYLDASQGGAHRGPLNALTVTQLIALGGDVNAATGKCIVKQLHTVRQQQTGHLQLGQVVMAEE